MDLTTLLERLHSNIPEELLEDDPLTVEHWRKLCRSLQTIEALIKTISVPPVGFIYCQLPKQNSPEELWPTCFWKPIEPDTYKGAFFRAEGGNAREFEDKATQEYAMPQINGTFCALTKNITTSEAFQIQSYIDWFNRGLHKDWDMQEYKFKFDSSRVLGADHIDEKEIRPTNYTVRLWKRVG